MKKKTIMPSNQNNNPAQVIQSEIQRQQAESRFQLTPTLRHTHNGTDSPPVSYLDLTQQQFAVSSVIQGTSAATAGNYGPFYCATAACTIQSMSETHSVNGSAGLLFVELLKPGQASGSGTAVQVFDMTVGALFVGTSSLIRGDVGATLQEGDRLSLFMFGTPTSLQQVVVTVLLQFN